VASTLIRQSVIPYAANTFSPRVEQLRSMILAAR